MPPTLAKGVFEEPPVVVAGLLPVVVAHESCCSRSTLFELNSIEWNADSPHVDNTIAKWFE